MERECFLLSFQSARRRAHGVTEAWSPQSSGERGGGAGNGGPPCFYFRGCVFFFLTPSLAFTPPNQNRVNGVAVQTTGSPLNKTALLAAVGKPFNVSSISGDFSAGGGGGAGFTKNKTISTVGAKAVSIGGKQVLPPVPAKNISLNIDGGGGLGGGIKVTTATP